MNRYIHWHVLLSVFDFAHSQIGKKSLNAVSFSTDIELEWAKESETDCKTDITINFESLKRVKKWENSFVFEKKSNLFSAIITINKKIPNKTYKMQIDASDASTV